MVRLMHDDTQIKLNGTLKQDGTTMSNPGRSLAALQLTYIYRPCLRAPLRCANHTPITTDPAYCLPQSLSVHQHNPRVDHRRMCGQEPRRRHTQHGHRRLR